MFRMIDLRSFIGGLRWSLTLLAIWIVYDKAFSGPSNRGIVKLKFISGLETWLSSHQCLLLLQRMSSVLSVHIRLPTTISDSRGSNTVHIHINKSRINLFEKYY